MMGRRKVASGLVFRLLVVSALMRKLLVIEVLSSLSLVKAMRIFLESGDQAKVALVRSKRSVLTAMRLGVRLRLIMGLLISVT